MFVEAIEAAEDDIGEVALEGWAAGNGMGTTCNSDGRIESSNSLGSCLGCLGHMTSKGAWTTRESAIVVSAAAFLGGTL